MSMTITQPPSAAAVCRFTLNDEVNESSDGDGIVEARTETVVSETAIKKTTKKKVFFL